MDGTPGPWDHLRQDLRDLPSAETPMPEKIGKYAVARELSRTSTSVLYLARDPELGRPVAIKVLRDDRNDPEFVRRFQREGAIAAALRHPNIVTVHEVGLWRETPYLVMDYVDGGTLAGRTLPPADAARVMLAAAEAMVHAHAKGVVHRDLKPANILLDGAGRPIVTDFGLAKSFRGDSVNTVEGSILGTPQYMAPEQVRGESARVDARTDVYALGAILYELLAGSPPYSDPNLAALFNRILAGEAAAPSSRGRRLPRALDAIALKALRREPSDRYASAAELAADLRAFLEGARVTALPPSILLRFAWPIAAASLAALLLGGWAVRSGQQRGARHRTLLQNALRLEQEGALAPARQAWRSLGEQFPGDPQAQAGQERIDWLERPVPREAAPLPESAWKELGGSAAGGGLSRTAAESIQVDLAVDDDLRPIVVWRDFSEGQCEIYLRRWDGSAWAELAGSGSKGGISNTPYFSRFPSIVLERGRTPWVAWDDSSVVDYSILLRRWDGKKWTDLGGSGTSRGLSKIGRGSEMPKVALDREGHPNVAWWQNIGDDLFAVYFRKWDGKEWIELGGSASGSGVSRHPRKVVSPTLALDPAGRPVIAWMAYSGTHYEAACARWDGKDWVGFGSVIIGGLSRALGWVDDRCALAVDHEGRPVVAWQDWSPGMASIYLKRWDGSAWVELDRSATGGGVSSGTGGSAALSLDLDAKGNPTVAWYAGPTGNHEIYSRRWDGTSWRDLGGAASFGGISRTPAGESGGPVVRLDRDGNPVVAWLEKVPQKKTDIHLKRFEEFAPAELRQVRLDRPGAVANGETVPGDAVCYQAVVHSAVAGSQAKLEVEVRPSETPGGWLSRTSGPKGSGSRVAVTIAGLFPGPYRWRARTVDDLGLASPWTAVGDFIIGPR